MQTDGHRPPNRPIYSHNSTTQKTQTHPRLCPSRPGRRVPPRAGACRPPGPAHSARLFVFLQWCCVVSLIFFQFLSEPLDETPSTQTKKISTNQARRAMRRTFYRPGVRPQHDPVLEFGGHQHRPRCHLVVAVAVFHVARWGDKAWWGGMVGLIDTQTGRSPERPQTPTERTNPSTTTHTPHTRPRRRPPSPTRRSPGPRRPRCCPLPGRCRSRARPSRPWRRGGRGAAAAATGEMGGGAERDAAPTLLLWMMIVVVVVVVVACWLGWWSLWMWGKGESVVSVVSRKRWVSAMRPLAFL